MEPHIKLMVGDHWGGKSALVSIRPKPTERQMAMRPSVTRQEGRLTSAGLMAVRNSVQGFLGNRCYKGWEEDRAADSKPCDTLTDVRVCTSQKGHNREKAFE